MTQTLDNQALDAEPPIASFLKSLLIGGGPVNAAVAKHFIDKAFRLCIPSRPLNTS